MLETAKSQLLENRWDEDIARGMSESELLLYRSNILGADKRVTNYGGGNTSAKVMETDPLTGGETDVLWVMQDALYHAYVNGSVPPGSFMPEDFNDRYIDN